VVLTNQDAASASSTIANQIAASLVPATQDALAESRTAQARRILAGLQQGTIDRTLFTANANAYFSDQALQDFASTLAPLGAVSAFVQTGQSLRGGMVYRNYRVGFPGRALRVWTYETPDGKLEQYQIAPIG